MQVLIYVLCFAFGILATIAVLLNWAQYMKMRDRAEVAEAALKLLDEQQKQAAEALQNSIAELQKRRAQQQPQQQKAANSTLSPDASVKERLRRAVELSTLQNKINKNQGPEFVMQHNELELEKLSVLKSIIADGFDPVITIRYNTGDENILLSSYIQSISKGLA